jgi:hypothetical protein
MGCTDTSVAKRVVMEEIDAAVQNVARIVVGGSSDGSLHSGMILIQLATSRAQKKGNTHHEQR